MYRRLRRRLTGIMLLLLATIDMGHAQPTELRSALPSAMLAGNTRFEVLGFGVYEASLWVEPGFKADEYERHAFALELVYQRDFTNEAITRRSIKEMQRQPGFPPAQLKPWQQALRSAFPDVHKGDRITGIHHPGEGAVFMTNGRQTGTIRDAEFSRLFFGIWLSVHTSEPRLREALLAGAALPR